MVVVVVWICHLETSQGLQGRGGTSFENAAIRLRIGKHM